MFSKRNFYRHEKNQRWYVICCNQDLINSIYLNYRIKMIGSRTHECTVIVVGDSGVGKTTLITTFNSEKTTLANINTIGVVNVNKEIGI